MIEVATRDKGSFAIRLPVRRPEAIEEADGSGVVPLLQFRQELALDLPQGLSASNVALNWALQAYQGAKKDRWRFLDLCVTGRPPIGLLAKDVGVVARWRVERPTTAATPWEAWSTDTDDSELAARRTVNLSIFFRHLLSQMLPQFGQPGATTPPQEPFARIQYRK
jgi:hypothetical protein